MQIKDQCTWEEVRSERNELKTIFKDGKFFNQTTLTKIRSLVNASVEKEFAKTTKVGTGVLAV